MSVKLPDKCPACEQYLVVQRLHCTNCQTAVEGSFALPLLSHLNRDEQAFLLEFIKASGSLKEMATYTGRSYPSVRNYLDDVIQKINVLEDQQKEPKIQKNE